MEKPKRKRSRVPVPENFPVWQRLTEQIRLSWALFWDARVPVTTKLIPLLGIAYMLSPLDLVPEMIFLLLGLADDVSLVLLALALFNSFAPREVSDEHLERIRYGSRYRYVRDDEGVVIEVRGTIARESDDNTPTDSGTRAKSADRLQEDEESDEISTADDGGRTQRQRGSRG